MKESKTFRFDKDVIEHSKDNPIINSFAEWCNDKYREEFMNVDNLASKLQDKINEVEYIKNQIREFKKKPENSLLSDAEEYWIKKEGIPRAKKFTFEGVYKAFVNHFNKKELTRVQFRKLLNYYDK